MARSKEQIKADNLALLPTLLEAGATYYGGIEKWTEHFATKADGLRYLSFEWSVVDVRPATAEEVEYGCDNWEDCPCCVCGEDVVSVITSTRKRWSHSNQSLDVETNVHFVCGEHKN